MPYTAAILREQFEFLLLHAFDCRNPCCNECDRMNRAATVLLERFHGTRTVQAHKMADLRTSTATAISLKASIKASSPKSK